MAIVTDIHLAAPEVPAPDFARTRVELVFEIAFDRDERELNLAYRVDAALLECAASRTPEAIVEVTDRDGLLASGDMPRASFVGRFPDAHIRPEGRAIVTVRLILDLPRQPYGPAEGDEPGMDRLAPVILVRPELAH